MGLIGQGVSEKKIFENGGRTTDKRRLEGYTLVQAHLMSLKAQVSLKQIARDVTDVYLVVLDVAYR